MNKFLLLSLFIVFPYFVVAQKSRPKVFLGIVYLENLPMQDVHVVNNTTSSGTITDNNGEFKIVAKTGDLLVFSVVNTKPRYLEITDSLVLQNEKLEIQLNEIPIELEEVDLGTFKADFGDLKKYNFSADRFSPVKNNALASNYQGGNILGLIGLVAGLFIKDRPKKEVQPSFIEKTKCSDMLAERFSKQQYADWGIEEDNIFPFLYYCDTQEYPSDIFKIEREFYLIDFLIAQSVAFKKTLNE